MFQKPVHEETTGSAETIIGPSVKVEGDLNAVGNVNIQGSVSGHIKTDKNVVIGDQAVIDADIKATNVTISGVVNGTLNVSGHLSIKASAKIKGDIKTKAISIESGAQINGMLNMGENQAAPDASLEESTKEK